MLGKIKYQLKKNINIKSGYLVLIGVISLFLIVGGFSFALFTTTVESRGALNIVTGNLYSLLESDSFSKNTTVTLQAGESKTITMTLKNVNTIHAKFNLWYEAEEGVLVNYVSGGDDPPTEVGYVIDSSKVKTYKIKMVNNTSSSQEVKFGSDVGLYNQTLDFPSNKKKLELGLPTLYDEIKKKAVLDNIQSEFVSSTTGINFGEVSSDTNGKGVYTFASTKDDKFPVHYYRGAVTDNNVKFANFCWKIVRTTETGGIKLIYNGTPDENGYCTNTTGEVTQIGTSAFNETYNSIEYVGYMVNNTSDSTIKGVIDNWYQTNMTDYTEKLDDVIWCNDRSSRVEGNNTYFGSYDRVYTTYSPSLECVNDADKFTVGETNGNGLLTYPVALLTSDEIMLAGGGTGNSSYYLYTNQTWWALSPSGFVNSSAHGLRINSRGGVLGNSFVYRSYGVRPALVLKPGTGITSGDGSQNSPFVVE